MRISDWSSDVCSSDLGQGAARHVHLLSTSPTKSAATDRQPRLLGSIHHIGGCGPGPLPHPRSEEHTSELQSLMRISYAVFCLKKKKKKNKEYMSNHTTHINTQDIK